MHVLIVGSGYVGLTTGACLSFLGHEVVCYDVDQSKIDMLNSGQLPFYEPYLADLVLGEKEKGRLNFSMDLAGCVNQADFIFICVGTPSRNGNGFVDLTFVRQAALSIGQLMMPGKLRVIVNKSTVPVGSNGFVKNLVLEGLHIKRNGDGNNVDFATASNPEFLREGNAVFDSLYPDRIIIGADDERATAMLRNLYMPIIKQDFTVPDSLPSRPTGFDIVPFICVDSTSAEVIKYAANAFLATKISFINEIANICQRVGADIRRVSHGIGLDSRIGSRFLNAGLGWGGSCFGKDLRGLISNALEYDYDPCLLKAVLDVNYRQRHICIKNLQETLKVIRGKTITLWGLSFKPGTDDLRDAPALDITSKLLEIEANIKVFDPVAMPAYRQICGNSGIQCVDDLYKAVENADGLIIVTEWPQFRDADWRKVKEKMRQPVIIDGRNLLNREELEAMGFVYRGVGIPS